MPTNSSALAEAGAHLRDTQSTSLNRGQQIIRHFEKKEKNKL